MKTVSYSSNGFITGSSIMWIVIISQGALFLMVPLFFLNVNPLLVTAIFVSAIYAGFMLVTGKVIYTIDETGITKDVTPNLFKNYWKDKQIQFFPWNEIRSYRTGRDAQRSMEEFNFLTINIKKGGKLEINDKKGNKEAFKIFEEIFRDHVEARMAAKAEQLASLGIQTPNLHGSDIADQPDIIEKPSFYSTAFAKALTVFLVIAMIGIVILMVLANNSRPANLFRLGFIILPGTLYMVWRVFVRKDDMVD